MKGLVVFASGSGTNFQSLIDAIAKRELSAKIHGLITDKPDIGSIERAKKHGIPHKVINPDSFKNESQFADALLEQLSTWDTDLIVLAGYLKKIPLKVIENYKNRILNIHPSLLPKYGGKGFYGLNVHKAVIENKESVSGCTVHLVNEEFDKGPILAQTEVSVQPDDSPKSLADRILKQEHKLLPATVEKYLNRLQNI
ncbi:phosphoribosylglycinamide formyltransferase [Gracilimonas sp. Q87]|uniref:phosphoribosylglycinamide formyltransferase n=1 Tax=Gracilimonas sp. Q87 TaxID=3384766 RepID=UPI003984055D